MKTKRLSEEKGIVLVLGMLLLLILTLIGISALNTSTYDVRISGNERSSIQAFYVAEAGINEFMGRFQDGATDQISDSDPSNPNWKVLLAKYPGKSAVQIGYVSGDPNSISSLQSQLDYGAEIKHKTDAANQVVQYGEAPIYILKSFGFAADGGNKTLEAELLKSPNYDPPSALYSEMPIHLHGSSIYINGNDGCGKTNKPGVITTATTTPPIIESSNPAINGAPPKVTLTSNPAPIKLPIKVMLDYLKGDANFKYHYHVNQTLDGYSESWGTPTSSSSTVPILYTGKMNIVYFDMNGDKTLMLTGDSHGAGILLIEGNLEINGALRWYGVILVTGNVECKGNVQMNITGGIIVGKNAILESNSGGSAGIIYCSDVSDKLKEIIPPLKMIRWREVY